MTMIDANTLRSLIRDVIAQEVGTHRSTPASDETIRISTDAELAAFARLVLTLAEDPAKRQAITSGTYPFRLEKSLPNGAPTSAGIGTRIDQGPITETMLARLPRGVTRLQVAPEVVVTPLAKDKARALGITIERIRK